MTSRFDRPPFDFAAYQACTNDEQRNRLLFDWWCDDDDRAQLIAAMQGRPFEAPGRVPRQNDPAPLFTQPAPQGFKPVYFIPDALHVKTALTDHAKFSNIPYATLGGAAFLLAQDPGPGFGGTDWHAEQRGFIGTLLGPYQAHALRQLADFAVADAELTALVQPEFDLARFAEQAALRYAGRLWGYGFQDHGLLEDTARATYRALQYIAIGQYFATEPTTLPAAQQALGRLVERTALLMQDYAQLDRAPRRHGHAPARGWPRGVLPYSESGLSTLGEPMLLAAGRAAGLLNGRDRAAVLATLLAGTLGNVQTAACRLVHKLLAQPGERERVARLPLHRFEAEVAALLSTLPPVPVVPRRTRDQPVQLGATTIPADTDCLVLLEGAPACPHAGQAGASPHVWGGVAASTQPQAPHTCLGQALSVPLIAALVWRTLRLPGLKDALDPLTGEVLKPRRLWGFACTSYPLVYERERRRRHQNLIVSMRVKSPVAEHAPLLRRLIASAVPRIEHELRGFGSVRHAWFEFSDDDTRLVLRTLYEGSFESYIQHFALRAGDLFDGLFEHLEDAPPRPVAEHPHEFVETIRRYNRAPLAGYLFSIEPPQEMPW